MNLGKAINVCRNLQSMTQTKLAERCELSVSYLSLLEQNKRDPSISTVEKIALALNVPVSVLVFLAAGREELAGLDKELSEKLSHITLELIRGAAKEPSLF